MTLVKGGEITNYLLLPETSPLIYATQHRISMKPRLLHLISQPIISIKHLFLTV